MRKLIIFAVLFSFQFLQAQTPLKVLHVVKKGETLYKISRDYEMTVSELRELNPQVGILQPGMKLHVLKKLDVQTRMNNFSEHTVKKGETLYRISQKYKVKVSEIREANGLIDNKINVGQTLKIPNINDTETTKNKTNDSQSQSILKTQQKAALESAKQQIEQQVNEDIKGGIIEKRQGSTKTEFIAKNDSKKPLLLDTSSAQLNGFTHKAFVWVADVPESQVVCITNPLTQQMAYGLNQGRQDKQNNESIILTPFMAEKLGLNSPATELKIQYVVPKP
jgi:LysM repeat protein